MAIVTVHVVPLTDNFHPPLCSQSPYQYVYTNTHTCIVLDSWPGSAKASCWSESWSTEQWTVHQITVWTQVSHWGEERWGSKRGRRRRGGGGRRRGRQGGGGRRGIKGKQGWWISRWLGESKWCRYVYTHFQCSTFILSHLPPSLLPSERAGEPWPPCCRHSWPSGAAGSGPVLSCGGTDHSLQREHAAYIGGEGLWCGGEGMSLPVVCCWLWTLVVQSGTSYCL